MNSLLFNDQTHLPPSRVIVALDFQEANMALNFIRQLDPSLCALKVGNELFTSAGPAFIEQLIAQGFRVFLDLKFHDIPNTVQKACQAAASLGVWMIDVHAAGGQKMLEAAANAIAQVSTPPLLIGVTVLTSLQEKDLLTMGIDLSLASLVLKRANMVKEAGLDGVVCSAQETMAIKKNLGKQFLTVTPGMRFQEDKTHDDQMRIMTPKEAFEAGSDYLVIGRPIIQAKDPLEKLQQIRLIQLTASESFPSTKDFTE